MNWKPTDGLRRAESVVQQILADNIACGVPPMTNPMARWRMTKTIAEALDGFRSTIEAEPEFPLDERDNDEGLLMATSGGAILKRENGEWREHVNISGPDEPHKPASPAEAMRSIIAEDGDKPSKRRGRGRPKLSAAEKKKRKAAKAAVEAEAAT